MVMMKRLFLFCSVLFLLGSCTIPSPSGTQDPKADPSSDDKTEISGSPHDEADDASLPREPEETSLPADPTREEDLASEDPVSPAEDTGIAEDNPVTSEETIPPENGIDIAPLDENAAPDPAAQSELTPSPKPEPEAIIHPEIEAEIEVFHDPECPFCRRFENEVLSVIRMKYPNVKIIIRYFPLSFHPQARPASKFLFCADSMGKFNEMLALISASSDISDTVLWTKTKELGLNVDEMAVCLSSSDTEAAIEDDIIRGRSLGVKGTPTFFLNGEMHEGTIPLENLEKLLKEL